MFIETIYPYIRLAKNDSEKKGWSITRTIWDYELIYVEEGEISLIIGDRKYVAKKNNLIFIKPKQEHTIIANTSIRQPHIHFDFYGDQLSNKIYVSFKTEEKMTTEEKTWFRNDNLEEMQMNFPTIISVQNYEPIKSLIFQIIDEYCFKNQLHHLYISSLMEQMLVLIARGIKNSKLPSCQKDPDVFDNVVAFILRNFERNPSLEEISNVANISKYHFQRVFKKRFNLTPHQYIEKLRLNRAKEYLQYYNEMSIQHIAKSLYFDSTASFCNWFYKLEGCTTTEFRNRINKQLRGK